jgi:hypothetical protein
MRHDPAKRAGMVVLVGMLDGKLTAACHTNLRVQLGQKKTAGHFGSPQHHLDLRVERVASRSDIGRIDPRALELAALNHQYGNIEIHNHRHSLRRSIFLHHTTEVEIEDQP